MLQRRLYFLWSFRFSFACAWWLPMSQRVRSPVSSDPIDGFTDRGATYPPELICPAWVTCEGVEDRLAQLLRAKKMSNTQYCLCHNIESQEAHMLELPVRPWVCASWQLGTSRLAAWNQISERVNTVIYEGCVYFWTDSLIHGSLLGCISPMYAGGLPKRNWSRCTFVWSLFPLAKRVYVYSHQGLMSPCQWSEVAIPFHPVGFCTVVVLSRQPDQRQQWSKRLPTSCHSRWEEDEAESTVVYEPFLVSPWNACVGEITN